ncbi:MAG: pyruvate kinase [Anaerovoracaceae bacterium]
MRKTKVICTLGPSSSDEKVMKQMILAGMNVARLNFSHNNHQGHKETIEKYRKVRDELGYSGAVLLDTKGPEVRLGDFVNGSVMLKKGQKFTLTSEEVMGDEKRASITYKKLSDLVKKDMRILIDDGRVSLVVEEVTKKDVICKVKNPGKISNHKGVNIPNTHLDVPYLSKVDKEDLLFGIQNDVDYVAASFVRSKEDVKAVRNFLNKNGGKYIKVISKIENMEGITNFGEILKESDGIMVARGDMGVEVDFPRLPGYQKDFIKQCNREGKIVITATQMLESMTHSPNPTRAEISDVANAVFDGTSAVMLSGESAMGDYPLRTVKTMVKIIKQAEKDALLADLYEKIDYKAEAEDPANAIGHAACTIAADLNLPGIIAATTSGHTALRVSKYRPKQTIIAATHIKKVFHQMSLVWGVRPVKVAYSENIEEFLKEAKEFAKNTKLVRKGDMIVVTAGVPVAMEGNTNLIKIETI